MYYILSVRKYSYCICRHLGLWLGSSGSREEEVCICGRAFRSFSSSHSQQKYIIHGLPLCLFGGLLGAMQVAVCVLEILFQREQRRLPCVISRERVSCPGTTGSGRSRCKPIICGDIIHLCMIFEVKIARILFLLEEVKASHKSEGILPIRSILSVLALGMIPIIYHKTPTPSYMPGMPVQNRSHLHPPPTPPPPHPTPL